MRWPDGDGHGPEVEAAVECADEIETGWEDEGDVIAGLDFAAFLQEGGDFLGTFVQLGAGEGFGDGACGESGDGVRWWKSSKVGIWNNRRGWVGRTFRVEQRVQDVIRRCCCPPSQHAGDVLVLVDCDGKYVGH